jgi:DNA-directed RNA polymerase specialized sigma24 family protein
MGDLVSAVATQFYPLVLRRARRLLRDDEAARDIAQDVLLLCVLAGNARKERGCASPDLDPLVRYPRAWLLRITSNLCFNSLRNRR